MHDISLHLLTDVDINGSSDFNCCFQLRRLGIKNVEAGIGCGVGIGHGFGIGRVSIGIYANIYEY